MKYRIERETLEVLRRLFVEQALSQENEVGGVFDFHIQRTNNYQDASSVVHIISSDEEEEDEDEQQYSEGMNQLNSIKRTRESIVGHCSTINNTNSKRKKIIIDHDEHVIDIDYENTTSTSNISESTEEITILTIQDQSNDQQQKNPLKKGRRQADYTLCEVHDDVPYTFHCHPIEIDKKTKLPINIANLISSEDMIGVVQDHATNSGYLSNCKGKLQFDILLCPMGMFVYSATDETIQKWIKFEQDLPWNSKNKKLMKSLMGNTNPENKFKSEEDFQKHLKHLIHTTLNEDNPYWATEENALMNEGFNKHIGSWYYLNRGEGIFAQEIIPKFKYMGYQFWWKDQVDHLKKSGNAPSTHRKSNKTVQDISEDEEIQCTLAEGLKLAKQLEWFKSEDFLSLDYRNHSLIQDYLKVMKKFGFYIEFYNWNSMQLDFVYP